MKKADEAVLLYIHDDEEKKRKVKFILVRMGIKIKNIDNSNINDRVGSLLSIGEDGPCEDIESDRVMEQDFMLMYGFTSKRIDELLMALRKSGGIRIPYKAVATESNITWSLRKLYLEIEEEHNTMNR